MTILERDLVEACAHVRPVAIVEHLNSRRVQRIEVEDEIVVLLQKRHLAAVLGSALWLVLRALIETAKPSKIGAGSGVDQEHVNLMVGDTDLPFVP